ncbi:BREX-2 system adenine-specific DNA-methyltransferase PglX [Frankia sp. Cas3]|uniref:BREX-2 system adenine-specific DNA-methyltransferase PglX n=1 Tax=Frankia sp. Cas3 TaxID=3073926 RepID=UPI002AD4F5AE|nr:BREX-2 system adenine-specific DNA-methyltransferase PglX [Frankia sp. Cas3]
MIDRQALSDDLARLVRALETTLASDARRSATQATDTAVAWVVTTLLLRFCEDNHLVPTGTRLATPQSMSHSSAGPQADARYGGTALDHLISCLAVFLRTGFSTVFDGVFTSDLLLTIPPDAADTLVSFWNRRDQGGDLRHDFTDPTLGTGFLADVYERLSDSRRKEHALVPTPDFVADLLLDLTLDPAIEEVGHRHVRLIDPVCGSGQFVLGAFDRLFSAWSRKAPELSAGHQVRKALAAVHGVDLLPSSVAITRFRLFVTALHAAGVVGPVDVANLGWPLNIRVGDSLLGPETAQADETERTHGRGYHVVVGNPPYLAVRDQNLSRRIREQYETCRGSYTLAVPFTQRFFQLARPADADGRNAGHVGILTSNSFMRREFGQRLATEFLAEEVTLTHVLDTSGAYIPGHGTPTVLLIGRNRRPDVSEPLVVVLAERGEPTLPPVPREGQVWRSIRRHARTVGLADRWTRSVSLDRRVLREFPWQLTDSTARSLIARMSRQSVLGDVAIRIGYSAITGADDVFVAPPDVFRRLGPAEEGGLVRITTGFEVRDWAVQTGRTGFFPRRDDHHIEDLRSYPRIHDRLWPYRTTLQERRAASALHRAAGRPWYDWTQIAARAGGDGTAITFSWVASHNHFALQRGRVVALQSAPVIELPEDSTRARYVSLVGLLNSSAACFWLKQHGNSKGSGLRQEGGGEAWQEFYEFTGANLQGLPLPGDFTTWQSGLLDGLAQERAACTPEAVSASGAPTGARLAEARRRWESVGREMVAIQEELDWTMYARYGILPEPGETLLAPAESIPPISPGERAFEIVLARRVAAGGENTTWFSRHGSTPITEIPERWPAAYRDVVVRRVDAIERSDDLSLLERPEFKRRWHSDGWDTMQAGAIRRWLLDHCETQHLWQEDRDGLRHPRPLTIGRLARLVLADPQVVAVAALLAPDRDPAEVLTDLLVEGHVPCAAALRHTPAGLVKRADWETVWANQRAEDASEPSSQTASMVPPKYTSGDFLRPSYWRIRGKLDVPNERFISYPPLDPRMPDQTLIGWAGWETAERAQVLADLLAADGVGSDQRSRITPLLNALYELLPWLEHAWGRPGPVCESASGLPFAEYFSRLLEERDETLEDLRAWRPEPPRRGRPRKIRS